MHQIGWLMDLIFISLWRPTVIHAILMAVVAVVFPRKATPHWTGYFCVCVVVSLFVRVVRYTILRTIGGNLILLPSSLSNQRQRSRAALMMHVFLSGSRSSIARAFIGKQIEYRGLVEYCGGVGIHVPSWYPPRCVCGFCHTALTLRF